MQKRQLDRRQYFSEQAYTTERYVLPYIEKYFPITSECSVLEIGCGDGGNLLPFLDKGCRVVGIDLSDWKIAHAEAMFEHHPHRANLRLIHKNIYDIHDDPQFTFDVIILRDTLEHIPDQNKFLEHMKSFLNPGGKVFIAFPPWRMPFGGHQQMCQSRVLSVMPYFHLFPNSIYRALLALFGETNDSINGLLEVKSTGISIQQFLKIAKQRGYTVDHSMLYFINPNYEVKFHLKPRKLMRCFNIPVLRDFYVTTIYALLSLEKKKEQK